MSSIDFIRAYVILNPDAAFATAENNHALIIKNKIIRTKTLEKMESKIRRLK
jgi:hypothetical protein